MRCRAVRRYQDQGTVFPSIQVEKHLSVAWYRYYTLDGAMVEPDRRFRIRSILVSFSVARYFQSILNWISLV